MNNALLAALNCPYCEGELHPSPREERSGEIENGILSCECSEFPVVGGIPILKRSGPITVQKDSEVDVLRYHPRVETILGLIRTGDSERALNLLLTPPRRVATRVRRWLPGRPRSLRALLERRLSDPSRRAARAVGRLRAGGSAMEAFDLYLRRFRMWPAELYNHYALRFGQPRHLAGLSLASLLPTSPRPILDLACGFGHLLHFWSLRNGGHPLIGLDRYFPRLFIAKRWMAPRADFVYADADRALPFRKASLSGVFCSDALHYFVERAQAAREAERVVDASGLVVIARAGNSLVAPREGHELTPEGYLRIFSDLPGRVVSERTLRKRYLEGLGPPLLEQAPLESLHGEKWISLVAARDPAVFRDHGAFADWPHAVGRLAMNPLYVRTASGAGGSAILSLRFPSTHYALENAESREYMPDSIEIGRDVLDEISKGVRSKRVESLIRRCAVVGTPEEYGAADRLEEAGGEGRGAAAVRAARPRGGRTRRA